jgi:hypothetical protein
MDQSNFFFEFVHSAKVGTVYNDAVEEEPSAGIKS